MIKFFRKIRHRLIKEKRFSSYLTYAVGEVLLVVVGILLALQFNNWNEERANKEKEEWYLINIVEDIEYQKGDLLDIKENYEESIKIGKQILKEYNELGSFSKLDSLNERLSILMAADNFPNIDNTYQELVNSGQQNLIRDKDLSIDIIDYFLFCEDNEIDFTINYDNIFFEEIYPVFAGLHQTNLAELEFEGDEDYLNIEDEKTNEYLREKLRDPENVLRMINALRINIAMDVFHLEMVTETLTEGTALVQKIDDYLGLTPDMVNNMYDDLEDKETDQ